MTTENTAARRPSLLAGEDRRLLVRMFLTWPFMPLSFWALGAMARIQARAAGTPQPILPRWQSLLRDFGQGFSAFWLLFIGLCPWFALLFFGFAWQVTSPAVWGRAGGLVLGALALTEMVLFLPGWMRLHGPDWRPVRPYWKAWVSAAVWPFIGDGGYGRALVSSAAGWVGSLFSSLILGFIIAVLTKTMDSGGFLGWSLLFFYYLLPLPLAVASRAAGLWTAEHPVTYGQKKRDSGKPRQRRQVEASKAGQHTRKRR